MNIIGIFNAHNAGVCLFQDGKLNFAVSEERLNRQKFSIGFPIKSLKLCLDFAKLKPKDINYISYGGYSSPALESIQDYFKTIKEEDAPIGAERLFNSLSVDNKFISDFFYNCGKFLPNIPIRTYDHHLCHALPALYQSSFSSSYILTADGRGDLQSMVLWFASSKLCINRVKTFCELKSLGFFYGQITRFLGFTPHRHEGKVTGLAAYGKKTHLLKIFRELISFDKGDIKVSSNYMPFNRPNNNIYLENFLSKYSKEDIAWAAQNLLEEIIINLINFYVPKNSNLCLSGGVFSNVKLNQRVRENCSLSNYFIYPEMGDGGISVGSAIAAAIDLKSGITLSTDMFLGPSFKWDSTIKKFKNNYNILQYKSRNQYIKKIVQLLIGNKVIGLFSGRMEFGPRSLGARSIIIATTSKSINDEVNKRLNRTEFMPFAPCTLQERASDMYIDLKKQDVNTKFMTTCYQCTDLMREISPAVVHVDNSARPQILDDNFPNKLLLDVLKAYYINTGIPNLINTSFNNHEEPIVCTPMDALKSLDNNNVDYIITDCLKIINLRRT